MGDPKFKTMPVAEVRFDLTYALAQIAEGNAVILSKHGASVGVLLPFSWAKRFAAEWPGSYESLLEPETSVRSRSDRRAPRRAPARHRGRSAP